MFVLRYIPRIFISVVLISSTSASATNFSHTNEYQSKRPGTTLQLIRDVQGAGGGSNGRSSNICWSSCFNNYNGCLEVSDKSSCVSRMKNCLAVCDKLSGNPNL